MDVIEALQSRRSIRAYKSQAVERETIAKILEAANRAPSWANSQPWEFFVATGEPLERLRKRFLDNFDKGVAPNPDFPFPQSWPEAHQKRIQETGAERFATLGIARDDEEARREASKNNYRFFGAPVLIYACMDRNLSSWSLYDMGSVSQSIMLAAKHYGLDTIPAIMLAAYPDIIREELQIPDDLAVVIGIALGYGDPDNIQNKYTTKRRPLDEFTKFIGF